MDPHSEPRPASLALETDGPEGTESVGAALGRLLFDGVVLGLVGPMGAGKTTFVRGLARGLEVEEPVTSPTFTLMQEHEGRLPLWHLDAWMAEREEAFLEAGGADVLGGEGVAVVEWAEHVADWLPRPRLELGLAPEPDGRTGEPPRRRLLRLVVVPAAARGATAAPAAGALQRRLESLVAALRTDAAALAGVQVPAGEGA